MLCIVLVNRHPGKLYMTLTWRIYGEYMVCAWCVHDDAWQCTTLLWKPVLRVHDSYMMCDDTWCQHDVPDTALAHDVKMMITWCMHVVYSTCVQVPRKIVHDVNMMHTWCVYVDRMMRTWWFVTIYNIFVNIGVIIHDVYMMLLILN